MHASATCGHRMVLCRPGRGCRAVLAAAGLWVAGAGAAVVRRSPAVALRQRAMGGRHAATKPGTDLFMAVVLLAWLALLAAVVTAAGGR